jgi:cobalt-zinc-cadmium efflux system outer membrane protein
MSLENILNEIEKNQPELKKYDAKINAYDTYASGAKALDAPQVGAGFFMTPYNPTDVEG